LTRLQLKSCIGCKTEKRIVARGLCNACYCAQKYKNNPEKHRAFARASYHKHIDKKREYDKKRSPQRAESNYENRRSEESKAKARERYYANKEYHRINAAKYRFTTEFKFSSGKSAAHRRGLEWGIDLKTFEKLINEPCYYCNSSLRANRGVSLDRINNAKGYIISNVLPCCGPCNKIRGNNLTVEEMKLAMNAVKSSRLTSNQQQLSLL
jgi:hypothetical protein